MRNIEEDIEKIKQLNNLLKFFKTHGWIPDLSREINTNGTIEAIEHMLTEREADKKRIKELEEENTEIKNTKMNEYLHKNLWLAKHLNELYIPVQKVKDKIEEYFEDEEWLIEHDLRALCDDEKECREYYINKKIALKDIKKNILDKLNKLLNNY